jgi:16S rRNA (cytidine1402-2'-O)-methyltransferase
VLFESPRRVAKTLEEVAEILGNRAACLARELTKRHEEVFRESASALASRFAESPPRGECTLVIAGATPDEEEAERAWGDAELDEVIRAELAEGASIRDLARDLAGRTGRVRRDVYARAVSLREEQRKAESGTSFATNEDDPSEAE